MHACLQEKSRLMVGWTDGRIFQRVKSWTEDDGLLFLCCFI